MRCGWILCCTMLILSGCGMEEARDAARKLPASDMRRIGLSTQNTPARGPRDAAGQQLEPTPPAVNLQRKVIYEADITLIVKEFSAIEKEIPKLVKQFGGYLADISVDRTQGEQRSGQWRARIPVDHYDAFLESISELGMPENLRQTAQDVTEEFLDLEVRIANKKRLEERIVELLKSSSDTIKDVIEVERELGRIRGEIEQMEGRLRYLTNRTELTTVTISAREVRDYVPPAAPGFTGRVGQAWGDSLLSFKIAGENAAVALVYASPWLLVLGVVLAPPVWCVRKRHRRMKKAAGAEQP